MEGGFFGNWIEHCHRRCVWVWLIAQVVKWGHCYMFELCMWAFCVFICALVQLGAFFFVYLVLLTDEIMIKNLCNCKCSLICQLWWNIHIYKARIKTELTQLPTWFNQVCPFERSSLHLIPKFFNTLVFLLEISYLEHKASMNKIKTSTYVLKLTAKANFYFAFMN